MELVVKHRDREAEVHLDRHDHGYHVKVDGEAYEIDYVRLAGDLWSLVIGGRQYVVSVSPAGGGRYRVTGGAEIDEVELMDPLTFLAKKAHGGDAQGAAVVTAYMPGRVVKILVEEGQEVTVGDGLVVLEAMKMENEIRAERGGVVKNIAVKEGQAVDGGDVLFELG